MITTIVVLIMIHFSDSSSRISSISLGPLGQSCKSGLYLGWSWTKNGQNPTILIIVVVVVGVDVVILCSSAIVVAVVVVVIALSLFDDGICFASDTS